MLRKVLALCFVALMAVAVGCQKKKNRGVTDVPNVGDSTSQQQEGKPTEGGGNPATPSNPGTPENVATTGNPWVVISYNGISTKTYLNQTAGYEFSTVVNLEGKIHTDGGVPLFNTTHDKAGVCKKLYGGDWQLPTKFQFEEAFSKLNADSAKTIASLMRKDGTGYWVDAKTTTLAYLDGNNNTFKTGSSHSTGAVICVRSGYWMELKYLTGHTTYYNRSTGVEFQPREDRALTYFAAAEEECDKDINGGSWSLVTKEQLSKAIPQFSNSDTNKPITPLVGNRYWTKDKTLVSIQNSGTTVVTGFDVSRVLCSRQYYSNHAF
jgi:gamma-glutamylcyclotransferase (GGCT)/AIG2-like uncharacterized protein YtfP